MQQLLPGMSVFTMFAVHGTPGTRYEGYATSRVGYLTESVRKQCQFCMQNAEIGEVTQSVNSEFHSDFVLNIQCAEHNHPAHALVASSPVYNCRRNDHVGNRWAVLSSGSGP